MKVILCGYTGKTGRMIYHHLIQKNDIQVVGVVNSKTLPLKDQLDTTKCDAVIDFTNATIAFYHGQITLNHGIHFLSGTTGLNDQEVNTLNQLALKHHVSCLICPNFSPGIRLIQELIPEAEKMYEDIRIRETHHFSKKDSPSGTSQWIRGFFSRHNSIPIESIRNEEHLMSHEVTFSSPYETIQVIHQVSDRTAYAEGVFLALLTLGTYEGYRSIS